MANAYAGQLLTKREIAKLLGLKPRGVECLMARRAIPFIRLSSRCIRFRWPEVEKALAKFTIREIG